MKRNAHILCGRELGLLAAIIVCTACLSPQLLFSQIISTVAGNGTQGYNGDNILATSAELNNPQGFAVDAAGNLYIGDMGNFRVRKVDISTGIITTIAGTGTNGYNGDGIPANTAQIGTPSALAFDGNGDLYFTDWTNRIRKITMATGIISTVAGTGTGGYNGDGILATTATLSTPNEVAFDSSGNLYIADWNNYRVRKVDKITGLISTVAGNGTLGYNGEGILATAAQLDGPCGIIFDRAGNMYLGLYSGHRIRKINASSGIINTICGTGVAGYNGDGIAATLAQVNYMAYIRFDAAENMYIGDAGNNRIRKITKSTGIISTVAGNGTQGYNGDGIAATVAELGIPFNLFFDVWNCNMYIIEYLNHRVRKVTGGFSGCPSPVAPGNLVSCQVLPSVTINNFNKNAWVPVFDSLGNIAAAINGNGNILGKVAISLFTKTGPCREDVNYRLYLNRNITITPQFQPSAGNVSVRLYVLKAELDSLKTALSSQGQPSGVASINEIDVFKNNDGCSSLGSNTALPLTAVPSTYSTADYYLQVSIPSFSSFYFANKLLPSILPVKISTFNGKRSGATNSLQWMATCNGSVNFKIERSGDGIHFVSIGNVTAGDCSQPFGYVDNNPLPGNNYYRLQINETGIAASYSNIIMLAGDGKSPVWISVAPNPVKGSTLNLQVTSPIPGKIELVITDIAGRIMQRELLPVNNGANMAMLNVGALAAGMYWVYGVGELGRTNIAVLVKN